MQINLPQRENGRQYISYSQFKSFNDKKSFNLKVKGSYEYMLSYFMGVTFNKPVNRTWGIFGTKVGEALEHNDFSKFSKKEKEFLLKAERLDEFETRIDIDFGSFFLKGYIDTNTKDLSYIKDYKTASENSKKQYYTDDYKQLDLYAEGVKRKIGKYPKRMNVEIIERNGNPHRGEILTVGERIWVVERKVDEKRIKKILVEVEETAKKISDLYTVYQELNA